jgi:hypothetical protein
LGGAPVDAVVELLAWRIESDAENTESAQWIATLLLPKLADGASRRQADFYGSNEFGLVVGMDVRGRFRIEPLQNSVKVDCAAPLGTRSKSLAKLRGAMGAGKQSFEERTKIETGASDDNGKMSTPGYLGERGTCLTGVFSGREGLAGIDNIDEVMPHAGAIVARRLGGPDFKAAIDGNRIATENFAEKPLREMDGESGFTGCRGAKDNYQGSVEGCGHVGGHQGVETLLLD